MSSLSAALNQNIQQKKKIIGELEKSKGSYEDEAVGVESAVTPWEKSMKATKENVYLQRLEEMTNVFNESKTSYRKLTADPEAFEGFTEISEKQSRFHMLGDHYTEYDVRRDLGRQLKLGKQKLYKGMEGMVRDMGKAQDELTEKYRMGLQENRRAAAEVQRAENIKTANAQQDELNKSIQADQQSLANAGDSLVSRPQVQLTDVAEEQRPV